MAEEIKVATPAGETVVTPPATPTVEDDKVVLTKTEVEELKRKAAHAEGNQRKANLYDKHFGSISGNFKPAAPVTPPTPEEKADYAASEDKKAERGLVALAADPAFRDVLDADPTLRQLLISNPLAVLPIYASDALDADDAISLVKEALTKLKKPATPTVATPTTPPATPPAGAVNPQDKVVDAEYEAAKGIKNTESAISQMIKVGIKNIGGKK